MIQCSKFTKQLAKLSPKAGKLIALGDDITRKQLNKLKSVQRKQTTLIKKLRKGRCKL